MRIFSQTAARHTSSSVLYFQLPCDPLHVATCVMRWCGTVRNTSGGRLLQIRELGGPRCRVNAHRTCWRYSTAQGAPEVARRGEPLFADLVVPFSDCPSSSWRSGPARMHRRRWHLNATHLSTMSWTQTPASALTPAVHLRPLAGARRAIPRRSHGACVAIASTVRSERRIAVRRSGVGIDASSASADPARGP